MGSGESGFIYVSMGSSVKAAKMPEHLRKLFIRTFAQIPYRVIWKYDGSTADMKDLPPNVKIGTWLPQQDILGSFWSLDKNKNKTHARTHISKYGLWTKPALFHRFDLEFKFLVILYLTLIFLFLAGVFSFFFA